MCLNKYTLFELNNFTDLCALCSSEVGIGKVTLLIFLGFCRFLHQCLVGFLIAIKWFVGWYTTRLKFPLFWPRSFVSTFSVLPLGRN